MAGDYPEPVHEGKSQWFLRTSTNPVSYRVLFTVNIGCVQNVPLDQPFVNHLPCVQKY